MTNRSFRGDRFLTRRNGDRGRHPRVVADVCLVRDGKPCVVVVTADKPSPVAAYAAQELVEHVKKATGQVLPVAVESAIPAGYECRVFIGACDAAQNMASKLTSWRSRSMCCAPPATICSSWERN